MENKSNLGKILLIILTIILVFVYYKRAKPDPTTISVSQDVSDEHIFDRPEIEQIVKEYILANPTIIIESIEKMHKRNIEEMNAKAIENLKKHDITNDTTSPTMGQGPLNIVMLYDYACNYCKKANEVVDQILLERKNIKIIYKPYPVLGDASSYMAKVVLAVNKLYPKKFAKIHNAIMTRDIDSREDILKILQENQISHIEIESEFESSDIKDSISNNAKLFQSLNMQGVPVFIVNNMIYPGFLSLEKMQDIIDQVISAKEHKER